MAVSILQLVGLGVLGLGVILHIAGTATPGWMVDDGLHIDVQIGLFKACSETRCDDIPENKWIRIVKALTLTGVVLSLLAGLLAVLAIVLRGKNSNLSPVPSVICLVLCLLAGLIIFLGVTIFGVRTYEDHRSFYKLGYSFGLCITGGILIVLGGAMVSAVCLQKPNNNQPVGTTAVVQHPPMMYPPQAGGLVYQNQAGGMVYQPQVGAMTYQPQSGEDMYQNQVGEMMYQPQAGLMEYQNQGWGMAHPSASTKENDNAKYTPGTDASTTKGKH